MATLSFYIRPLSTNKDKATINFSYSWKKGVSPFRKSLGLEIHTRAWDPKKEIVKNISIAYKYADNYNNRINEIIELFKELDHKYSLSYVTLKKETVKEDWVNSQKEKEVEEIKEAIYFTDYFKEFIEFRKNTPIKKTGKKVGYRSIQHYETTLRCLKEYESGLRNKLLLKDIDLKFHSLFTQYLTDVKKLSLNTVGGYIKDVKTFSRHGKRIGLPVTDESISDNFFRTSEESETIVISEKEIDIVYQHDFSKNPRFEKVRDWFIIGVWTGLRVSDWNKVVSMEDGFVSIKTQKTGKIVVIPIHWMIEDMIKERGLPNKLSDVEYNRVIKKVFKECEITHLVYGSRTNKETKRKEVGYFPKNELITSHACRRSFATNLYKSGFPSISIMPITGHTTEQSFLKYIRVSPKEHAERLKEHWDKRYSKINSK